MQAILGWGHEAIEQRDVEAVEILQGVEHAELGPQVEMKRGVANGSEVNQNYISMRMLQRHGGVDCGGGASGASFGASECKFWSLARAPETAGAGGTEASQSFEQRVGTGGVIEIFAGTCPHAGHDVDRAGHFAVGEDGNLLGGCANQFDGMDGALRVLRGNVDDDHFGARILKLTQNGVGGSGGKPGMAEHNLAQARRFQTILQCG